MFEELIKPKKFILIVIIITSMIISYILLTTPKDSEIKSENDTTNKEDQIKTPPKVSDPLKGEEEPKPVAINYPPVYATGPEIKTTKVQLCNPYLKRDCERKGDILTCEEYKNCINKYGQSPCLGDDWYNKCLKAEVDEAIRKRYPF